MQTYQFTWKLPQFLADHNLTAYRLAAALRGKVAAPTIYRWAKETPKDLRVSVLVGIVSALEELTGHPVATTDLFDFDAVLAPENAVAAASASGIDPESRAWLDADLSRLARYPLVPLGEDEGLPVRYIEGRGFVVGEQP
jgi:hypothetical protein